MTTTFEYGTCRLRDLQVPPVEDAPDRINSVKFTNTLTLKDRPVKPGKRFWNSLQIRFGFTHNIFRYFSHEEVFRRISTKAPDDKIRYCLENGAEGTPPTLLAVSNPKTGVVLNDELENLLTRYRAKDHTYHDGIVRSYHVPRHSSPFTISGDGFEAQYVIETPIDGFGRPAVYLAMLRQICSNGAIAMTPAFRSEISLGRGGANASFGLERALEGFNNEEGFAALRQRFESSTKSWASVHEVARLARTVSGMLTARELPNRMPVKGGDGANLGDTPVMHAFGKMAGDLTSIYGLANMDALSAKRQRTLPTACRVYDLLNFASELATHHAKPTGGRKLQAYIGDLVSGEYDLEGTADQFADWKDFFIDSSARTVASKRKK
ncbi:DUF932 domain-containing protein [Limnoglobus roseus]|uniref:DUF932 domain-containing protein n=1 Tax=Limnoglobus roseus TaxID=2598579 RepID=A0A5C1A8A2_9BACT|nr:DUF932 domain-containing protein [Limnoglobus roseus]QEL14487.1 hypothetical protein PX52LOC_01376 [Limnoglobus roseus]